ncbi:Na+/H+ antiporter involved in sodium and potassium efflux through the plasma membrane [Ogataea parapolymorpha DL-1]|uniref:Na+/H+ antiporter involved in sodium and potassium efflux through the plasma membrane n=1 Tax=Ogataea parapolymorpha (strain ATCC 26012 / BCRC 20466 / JCM 22074 / NRRL Y-7560 / DL-1) TaxID=871575 RepID=W1QK70_OGAPD|nr:Na+/H+ antiporter involved in sodium and potassium efflux through the plasma membrane [Ogataea parapolymorpha DL-1]ESX02252.1 Na+/H+ antiporter involved in sodium and potassium efflux through the plasma membrane [Ogataea parapolymorpha DL-1]
MVWEHINPDKAHVAYAVLAVFSSFFSLCSLFIKERLYIGEASVATIYGLIVGPHCLDWFDPSSWGNEDYITLEISRVILCIEIVAVAVELPKKYILKHWLGVFLLLIPVMTIGWLVIGLFIWLIIPGLHYGYGLLISACITATDPVLAQAVVGKGKFARRVPAHLRNLLTAESACNDGVSVPFVYLAVNIIIHGSNAGAIARDWITVTVLYECLFGCILGGIIGFLGRKLIQYAEEKDLIDRESFLAFYVMLALLCAGFGAILGVDDLLASFAAGATFAWDGRFTERTEESHVSSVIDLLLNLAYFVYFGTIIPWEQFNNKSLGLNWWRLVCIAIVVIFLRRIPAVLAIKPFSPDIKNWKEALFVGHFGPIGVGAVFASILAIGDLEAHVLHLEHGPTAQYPDVEEYHQLIRIIWPTVCFLVLSSIIVHGSSVAVMTLGRHLQTMTFTMTLTKVETDGGGWISRLPKLEKSGTSFSIKRIDTMAPSEASHDNGLLEKTYTSDSTNVDAGDTAASAKPAGSSTTRLEVEEMDRSDQSSDHGEEVMGPPLMKVTSPRMAELQRDFELTDDDIQPIEIDGELKIPTYGYRDGTQLIIEDQNGEILHTFNAPRAESDDQKSMHSLHSLSTLKSRLADLQRKKRTRTNDGEEIQIEDFSRPEEKIDQLVNKTDSDHKMLLGQKIKRDKNNKPHASQRYHGFRIDDNILIENADGEVVGRFKINQKKKPAAAKADTLDKALKLVGLLKEKAGDVEQSQVSNDDLIPTDAGPQDKRLEDKLKKFLTADTRKVSVSSPPSSSQKNTDSSTGSDSSNRSDSYNQEESEVERARRLAALASSSRDPEDEEDEPATKL